MSGDNAVTDTAEKPLFSETPEEREFELRSAVGAYWTGGLLLIGMYTFLFASLAFAYFYLKSNNSGKLWRPDGITAPTGVGRAIFAIVVAVLTLIKPFLGTILAIYTLWVLLECSAEQNYSQLSAERHAFPPLGPPV